MGGGGYDVMLELVLFIAAQWLLGRLFRRFGAPDIVAYMIAGIALGPEGAAIIPYATEDHVTHDPSILVLIGNMGVALMIFESGMHLHFDKVAEVGWQALGIAIVGTLAPIALGIGVGVALGFDAFPDSVSMGVSLAPTSVGISLFMLGQSKMLNSTPGQTIITAAFIDDIFSLVMLVILINISAGEVTAESIVLPLVYSFAFVGGAVLLSVYAMPSLPRILFKRFKQNPNAHIQPSDELHIGLMVIAVVFFGWIGALIGSHLLGTFAAGVAFANVPRSGLVWTRQAKRIVSWMVRLFFSASIGFSIPISVMFTVESFWKGLVLGFAACIGGKLLSGQCSGNARWIVGWAMVARGEFAYLVAQTAKEAECKSCSKLDSHVDHRALASSGGGSVSTEYPMMLSPKAYACLIWALLWSTVLAPIVFKMALGYYTKKRGAVERATDIGGADGAQAGQRFVMRLVGMHHTGVLHEVMSVLHACELDVLEAVAESDGVVDIDKFVVMPRSGNGDVDDDKLHEIAERVKEAINDDESQVVFEPIDAATDLETAGVLEIRIIGDHHPDILHEIFDELALAGLDVVRALVDEHHAMDGHGDKKTPRPEADSGSDSDLPPRRNSLTNMGNLLKRTGTQKSLKEHHVIEFKETDIIYARGRVDPQTGKRSAIKATKRAALRKRIQELFHSHDCHGEAMLRMVTEEDAHENVHPITAINQDDQVCIVSAHGKHHPDILHEFLDCVSTLHLEVLHADIIQPGTDEEDKSLLYVRNTVDEATAALKLRPATERNRRHAIRKALTEVYEKHNIDGHVSVRPLEGSRPAIISKNISTRDLSAYESALKRTISERADSFSLTTSPVSKSDLEAELDKAGQAGGPPTPKLVAAGGR